MIREIDASTAARLASGILGAGESEMAQVEVIDVGFANQNWRVTWGAKNYVLKIGPASSAPKWAAATAGLEIASEVGLAVPTVRFNEIVEGRCVRMLDWVEGSSARSLCDQPVKQARLGDQLGCAIAALHGHRLDWFGSRLDGSTGTFGNWADYVDHRLDEIQARASLNAAPRLELLAGAAQTARNVLPRLSDACRPVVCHRDLHTDNLIVDDHGNLVAILDWDMTEAWDQAGEWFKLETMLFVDLPGTCAAFEAAYFSVHANEALWRQWTWLVKVIETMNVIANAPNHSVEFTASAVERLGSLVA